MKEEQVKRFVNKYKSFKDPSCFIKNFDSEQEFRQWCELGTVKDLQCTLKAFEAAAEYEHCKIINEVLKSKVNEQHS